MNIEGLLLENSIDFNLMQLEYYATELETGQLTVTHDPSYLKLCDP